MSSIAFQVPAPGCVVEMETDWRGYLKVLAALEDRRMRVTFDRGSLEIMSPSEEHEVAKSFISSFVEAALEEFGIEFRPGGNMTFRRQDLQRGLEPDECYWIANWETVTLKKERYNPLRHPPPDLAIEVEVTQSMLDRVGIYEAMGVPEIWRWTQAGTLKVLCRNATGTYEERARSSIFPDMDPEAIAHHIHRSEGMGMLAWLRTVRAWLRSQIPSG